MSLQLTSRYVLMLGRYAATGAGGMAGHGGGEEFKKGTGWRLNTV